MKRKTDGLEEAKWRIQILTEKLEAAYKEIEYFRQKRKAKATVLGVKRKLKDGNYLHEMIVDTRQMPNGVEVIIS